METTLRFREKVSYTSSLFGQNLIYSFMAMYIMFFFTDLLGISAMAATIIVVVASLWDAINDPLMGMITDKTRTKWGKFRPYLIFTPIFLFITTVLCYVQFNFGTTTTIVVAAISYTLWGMTYTIIDIPIWAISAVVSKKSSEKNTMVTLGKIGSIIGTAVVTVGSILIINAFGGERTASAYTITVIIIAAIACLSIVLAGLTMRERIQQDKVTVPMRKNIKTITQNKPLILLLISIFLLNLVNAIRQGAQMYFVVYVWGDSNLLTLVGAALVIGMISGMAFTPTLIKRFGNKKLFIWSCIYGGIISIIPFFTGSENIPFTLTLIGISFFFSGIVMIVSTTMLIDAVDYSEWKLGFRGEGIIFSVNTFIVKLSGTASRGVLGIGLVLMNYTEGQVATQTLVTGFNAMIFLIPSILFFLTILPLVFHKVTNDQQKAIQQMLIEKYE